MSEEHPSARALRRSLEQANAQGALDRAKIEALEQRVAHHQREAQHAIRNTLSVVRSIARRTVAECDSPQRYQARLEGRLDAFARLQSNLFRDADGGTDLGLLIAEELLVYDLHLGRDAYVDGATICVKPRPAIVLGLAFHELARMAIEAEGFSDVESRLDVHWRSDADGVNGSDLQIDWMETGRPRSERSHRATRFERDVLERAVAYEFSGTAKLDQTCDGLTCRFRIPSDCFVPG